MHRQWAVVAGGRFMTYTDHTFLLQDAATRNEQVVSRLTLAYISRRRLKANSKLRHYKKTCLDPSAPFLQLVK